MIFPTHKVFYQHSKVDTQTYSDAKTHRHAEKTCRHKHTHRHTNTYINIQIYADKCTNTQRDKHAKAHTHRAHNHGYTDKLTQRLTVAQLCETHTNRHTWRHIKTYKQTHTDLKTYIHIDLQDMERYKNTQQGHRGIQTHRPTNIKRHRDTQKETHTQTSHSQRTHTWIDTTHHADKRDTEVQAYTSPNTCWYSHTGVLTDPTDSHMQVYTDTHTLRHMLSHSQLTLTAHPTHIPETPTELEAHTGSHRLSDHTHGTSQTHVGYSCCVRTHRPGLEHSHEWGLPS